MATQCGADHYHLRQIDVLVAQGRAIVQAWKDTEMAEQSYYRWRNEGGLETEQANRFKELEQRTPGSSGSSPI